VLVVLTQNTNIMGGGITVNFERPKMNFVLRVQAGPPDTPPCSDGGLGPDLGQKKV